MTSSSSPPEEVKKDIKHLLPVKSPFTHFNQQEKDRISMMIRKEISIVERERYNHSNPIFFLLVEVCKW